MKKKVLCDVILLLFINISEDNLKGDQKAPFSVATTRREGRYSFTLDRALYCLVKELSNSVFAAVLQYDVGL